MSQVPGFPHKETRPRFRAPQTFHFTFRLNLEIHLRCVLNDLESKVLLGRELNHQMEEGEVGAQGRSTRQQPLIRPRSDLD